MDNLLKVMTCGSVDDGKSTLLGRILFETNNIYQDQSNYLSSSPQLQDGLLDYSLLLDGLIDEKEQGITIDLAFKYLNYKNKNIIFIDSPGHKEFTKNTAYAATLADIAIVLVDSTKGISEQTKNHLEIISIFKQIETVIFAVNKLDIVQDPQVVFDQIKNELEIMCENLSISNLNIVPISALKGDNIINKSNIVKNYDGNPLVDILSSFKIKEKDDLHTTISVQSIKKDLNLGRLVFCEKLGKDFKVGENLINLSSKEKVVVEKIYADFKSSKKTTKKNRNLVLSFEGDHSISNTDILCKDTDLLFRSDTLKTTLVWTSKSKQINYKRYNFKFLNQQSTGFFSKNLKKTNNSDFIFESTIELEEDILASNYNQISELSNFIVVDIDNNETVGFGYIKYSLDRGSLIFPKVLPISKNKKAQCLWLTGLSGSGKTTLAENLGIELNKLGIKYYILDGDNVRKTLNKDLGFSESDRYENNRRIAHVAKILSDSGVFPIVTTISPYEALRAQARSLFEENMFKLIYIDASIETCIERDPKNIYKLKKSNQNLTGLHMEYEKPLDAELIINTEENGIEECVEKILSQFYK